MCGGGSIDGAWSLPRGDEYYKARLRQMTSTDLNADQIHQIGLDEVKRIHGEMDVTQSSKAVAKRGLSVLAATRFEILQPLPSIVPKDFALDTGL